MSDHQPPKRRRRSSHVRRRRSADPQRPDAEMLLRAYVHGAFPMAASADGPIHWLIPDPRGILPLDRLHVPRSLARVVRSGRFTIRIDHDVEAVMRACAGDRISAVRKKRVDHDGRVIEHPVGHPVGGEFSGGWMSEPLLDAYIELAKRRHVHSVEAWLDTEHGLRLVGGLYGVRIAAAFFGESMFCRPDLGGTDASKVCLVHLVERLRRGGFRLLDTQMVTEHMRRFGTIEIDHEDYMRLLESALEKEATWSD